jgi:DNA polymerase family A
MQDPLLVAPEMPGALEHYRFNIALLNIFLYLELRGIRYHSSLVRDKVEELQREVYKIQHLINTAIFGPGYLDVGKIEDSVLFKRRGAILSEADFEGNCRASFRPFARRIYQLIARGSEGSLDPSEMGELSMLAQVHFNCESSLQKKEYLYKTRGFELVKDRKTQKPTTNYEALLTISKRTQDPVVQLIINQTSSLTRLQMLGIHPDDDGRIRCGYNVVGTETGRITCYTSPTGSGYNLQTIPQQDRDLYLADEGCWMFQCDLSGADAWTVAAWCDKMGDSTMLDDLKSGIAIAKVVALMFLKGPQISNLPREDLRLLCNEIKKGDPVYFGSKCVQHATNYDARPPTISATIFTQSEGTINIPSKECGSLQQFYNLRYPGLQRWKNFAANVLLHVGRITSASGHTRVFYGNRRDHHTFKQYLAHEPQANTTYATNLAALRLWKDMENRGPTGKLTIEPLHQVHDALLGQFPQSRTRWACEKIRSYFDNPLTIAGRQITIPFEGVFGESWGNLKEGTI